jgi:hypothetical protein
MLTAGFVPSIADPRSATKRCALLGAQDEASGHFMADEARDHFQHRTT